MTKSTGFAAERREMREMNLYRCPCCQRTRHASDFHRSANARWGLQTTCIDCSAAAQRASQARKREGKVAALALVDRSVRACSRCGETKPIEQFHRRTQSGREHQHYSACKDCWKLKGRAWVDANAERAKQLTRDWFAKDPERSRAIYRAAQRRRLADPVKRLHARVSNQVWQALRGRKSGRSTESLLGYTFAELHAHLERQFTKGMTWENYGQWHIDHIIPLSSFTIAGPGDPELRRAWGMTNLRPLWAEENLLKRNKRVSLL